MLPIYRWPEYLYRIALAAILPQRMAWDAERRLERQWAINRGLWQQNQQILANNQGSIRDLVATIDDRENEIAGLKKLAEEQARRSAAEVAGWKDQLRSMTQERDVAIAQREVDAAQIELLEKTLAKHLQNQEAEARIAALRGRRKPPEPT
jgi:hypothetical protein